MNITIRSGVVLSPSISRCLSAIDPYFSDCSATITSGLRTVLDQIRIIKEKVARHGIEKLYPEYIANIDREVTFTVPVDDYQYYWWQRAWSKLLNIGDIVNPPVPAEALFDYIRPGSTLNKKGRIIEVSPHLKGTAFDLSGPDLEKIRAATAKAYEEGKSHISGFLEEKVNNAIHVDVNPLPK